ncbi:membrane protein insertase YidC [Candidatus Sumerlaeota bacterium]|nr:membrane protein insertase YidC [Candidatus Sumerlaeota bacterium]
MDNKRFFLFLIVSILALQFYLYLVTPEEPPVEAQSAETGARPSASEGSPEQTQRAATREPEIRDEEYPERDVVVETGVFRIEFTTHGARPHRWEITDPHYAHVSTEAADSLETDAHSSFPQIIPQVPEAAGLESDELPLQVELVGWPRQWDFNQINWQVVSGPVEDESGAIHLVFESPERGGLVLTKAFTFHRVAHPEEADLNGNAGGYLSQMTLTVRNAGNERIALREEAAGMRLTWGPGIGTYEPVGFYNIRTPLVLLDDDTWYKAPRRGGQVREIAAASESGIDWAGLQSRYFLAAIIPAGDSRPAVGKVQAMLREGNVPTGEAWRGFSPLMTISLVHGPIVLAPGESQETTYDLYVGPKHRPHLIAAGHELSRTNFYNSWFWMRGLAILLTHTLTLFHGMVGNYGWAILILTILIRLLLYPLTHKQMRIMAKTQREMARIKPVIDEIREKYKGDHQKIQRETMAAYREHGVNPFAGLKGCLPLLLQMPIFFALWRMLASEIQLRGASWLWIEDLSGPDALIRAPWLESLPLLGGFLGPSLNLLPILMAVTQWMTMRLSSTQASDPNQRMMMNFMPIMLTVFLFRAPSGLMIYWVAGNIWQMGHQYLTTRALQRQEGDEPETALTPQPRPQSKGKGKDRRPTSAKSILAEKRKEAQRARRKAVSEDSSLPRWARRG